MAVGRRRRHIAAEVSLLSRTSTAAFLFLGVTFYGIGDTTGRHVPVTAANSSLPDSLNEFHSYNTSLTTDTPVPLPTTTHTHGDTTTYTHGDTTTVTHGDTTTYTHGDTTTYTHGDTTTYTHGDTTVLHKVTLPVTAQTVADDLPTSLPQKVTTRHLSTTGGSSVDVGVGVGVPTQGLPREKQYLELATERLHDTEADENMTRFSATTSADRGHRGSKLDNKTHNDTMMTKMRTETTTVKTVSSVTVRGHRVTTSRKHLTKTVSTPRVHSPVAVTTVVPPQPQPTGYEDYFMPVNQEDWEAYTEEDHDDEPEDNNDTEDKSKTEDMKNKLKANTIQESDIFSMREDGFGPISDIKASQIEVKSPLISHSFLAENSMGLLVIYTWIVMVTVIAIVTMVIVKHKQQLVDALWERRFKTARTRRVDDTYEEEHNLLPYPQV